ncbi:DUF4328 domain-containing protein [Streptomyces sp. NPDC045431]|uniref:DUF4328 domain-containing protein n=1 Tax=Streptomyces sp. NPDC045431 TaxID=3155613 RepID=UPI0033D30AC8
MSVLRSPIGLSRAVVALLGVVIAVDCYALYADLEVRRLMQGQVAAGQPRATVEGVGADVLMSGAGVLESLSFLATAVVFILWFHRVRVNAGVFAPDMFGSGPGWAIGAWFIPIANVVIPCKIARQTWRASRRDPYAAYGKGERPTLVMGWWLVWLFSGFVDALATRAYDDADRASEFVTACEALAVSEVADAVAAVLAIVVVRRLTAMQDAKAQYGPVLAPAAV